MFFQPSDGLSSVLCYLYGQLSRVSGSATCAADTADLRTLAAKVASLVVQAAATVTAADANARLLVFIDGLEGEEIHLNVINGAGQCF
jgi:hypothetical protein